ncbi:MAG: diguanylate cyclase [Immundisolibacteraceae bacterium]|nr:diguanylate cyclase [Immundisolibacteraceae bacterium]
MATRNIYEIKELISDLRTFIGVLDLDGHLVFGNSVPLEISGVTRDEVIDEVFWTTNWFNHDPKVVAEIKNAFDRAVMGEVVSGEILAMLGGRKTWMEYVLHPKTGANGSLSYIVAEGMVIERRKQAESELIELNRELEWRVAERTQKLEEANLKLKALSETDFLTQLANRQLYDQRFKDNVAIGQRANESVGLLMVDIDHFKEYNDHYGHDKGDHALKLVAAKISESLPRKTDLPARFGGEEFVVLLPITDQQAALAVAERIRLGIEAMALRHEYFGPGAVLTVSIGVASLRGSELNEDDLLNHADRALYIAKEAGRNRCQVYGG